MVRQSTRGGPGDQKHIDSTLSEAESALKNQDFRSALRLARKVQPKTADLATARAHYYAAAALIGLGQHVDALADLEAGFAIVGERPVCERALLLVARAKHVAEHGELDDALELADEAERILLSLDESCPVRLASVRLFVCCLQVITGRMGAAEPRLKELLTEIGGDHPYRPQVLFWLSLCAGFKGDTAGALMWGTELLHHAEAAGDPRSAFDAKLILARFLENEHDLLECIREAEGLEDYHRAEARVCYAGFLAEQRPAEALRMLDEADPYVERANARWIRLSVLRIEERLGGATVSRADGGLIVKPAGTTFPNLDVAQGLTRRFLERAARLAFGSWAKAAPALGKTKWSVGRRRGRKGTTR